MLALILLFLHTSLTFFLSAEAASPSSKKQIDLFEAQIKKEVSFTKRLQHLELIKSEVHAHVVSMEKDPQKDRIEEYSFFVGLEEFLEPIPNRFSQKDCQRIHDKVIFAFSPKNDQPQPQDIPGEAQESLTLLKLVCEGRP